NRGWSMRFCGLVICVLFAGSVAAAELPGASFANFSNPVRKEVEKDLKMYVSKKHGCKRYTVRDTMGVREEGDILVDGKRRLMAGTIVEEWDLEACGKLLKLALAIAADGA